MKQKNKAIIYIICSAFCFALMSTFIKLAGDLPAIQKGFFRNFIAMLFALALLIKERKAVKLSKESVKYLLLRSSFGVAGIVCNFYAVDHLVLSDASMLNKMSPFFAVVFSILILKEKVTPLQVTAVVTAFVGSMFILKPSFINADFFPSFIGLLGGLCAGFAYTCVRALGNQGVKGPFVVFFFSAFSSIVLLPLMIANFAPMTTQQLIFLICCGLSAAGGQFSITAAYMNAPAREISIYDYSQLIFTTIIGYILFNQTPDIFSFIGYFIIISMAILMFIYNNKKVG